MVAVVVRGAVGDLDDQSAGAAQQQRQGVMAGDGVGLHREAQQPQSLVEVVLPDGRLPVEEVLAAPDVVDQDVEAALLGVDPVDERLHLRRVQMVGGHGDAPAARLGDQVGGVLDRLGPVVLGAAGAGGAAGDVHRGARRAEFHGDAPSGSPGRPGHQRDLVPQRLCHVSPAFRARVSVRRRRSSRVSRTSSVAFSVKIIRHAPGPPGAPGRRCVRTRGGVPLNGPGRSTRPGAGPRRRWWSGRRGR